ncbi:MerR family transcriptional regulator [Clostridium sediminicola]|uniref:MerR family transcriptional regulator n=1 Tax=Clostridium sediminicola TaxID=3114879 RepID=UPI0031F21CF6
MDKKFKIGEIAMIKNIDAQTLRYYDRIGILSPEIIDNENGYRYYSEEQFWQVDKIKFYKMLGLSLEEIKEFKEIHSVDEALDTIKLQKEQLENKIKKMQAVASNIEAIIKRIERTRSYSDNIENLIEVRNCNSIYGVIGDCRTVNDWYEFEKNLLQIKENYPNYAEIGHTYGMQIIFNEKVFYDIKDENIDKIILPIDKKFINNPNVQEYSLQDCVVGYHKGRIENLKDTLLKIKKYIDQNDLLIKGEVITNSIIGSFIVNNPDEYLIEIKVPIKTDI